MYLPLSFFVLTLDKRQNAGYYKDMGNTIYLVARESETDENSFPLAVFTEESQAEKFRQLELTRQKSFTSTTYGVDIEVLDLDRYVDAYLIYTAWIGKTGEAIAGSCYIASPTHIPLDERYTSGMDKADTPTQFYAWSRESLADAKRKVTALRDTWMSSAGNRLRSAISTLMGDNQEILKTLGEDPRVTQIGLFSVLWDRANEIAKEKVPEPRPTGFYDSKVHTRENERRIARWVEIVNFGVPREEPRMNDRGIRIDTNHKILMNLKCEFSYRPGLVKLAETLGVVTTRRRMDKIYSLICEMAFESYERKNGK